MALPQLARPEDIEELENMLAALEREIPRHKVLLMPEATTLAPATLPVPNISAPTPTSAAPIGMMRLAPNRSMAAPATRLNGE